MSGTSATLYVAGSAGDYRAAHRRDPLTAVTVLLLLAGIIYPFVRVAPALGSDTQPLALAAALVILASSRLFSLSAPLVLLGLVAVAATLLIPVGGGGLPAVRNWSNYAALFVIAVAVDAVVRDGWIRVGRLLTFAVLSWFVIGGIQTFLLPNFGTWLLVAARTGATRGAVGLAPEPTTYALQCILFALTAYVALPRQQSRWLILLCVAQVVLFARSTMGVMLLGVWGAGVVVQSLRTPRRVAVAMLGAAAAVVLGYLVMTNRIPVLADSRLAFMARMVFENPRYLFFVDESGALRVSHVVYSLASFGLDKGMPHGFAAWDAHAAAMGPRFAGVFPEVPGGYRPMSGYGAGLFELGYIGLIIPVAVTWGILRFRGAPLGTRVITAVTLNVLLLTAIPLATPGIAFLVGYLSGFDAPPPLVGTAPGEPGGYDTGRS